MNKRSFFFVSLVFCGFLSACISDDSEDINSLIEETDILDPPTAPYSKRELSSEDFEKEIDGKKYQCKRIKYSFC